MRRPFAVVWRYTVAPGNAPEFERVYGPSGPWSSLFRASSSYEGSVLLPDREVPGRYLLIDRWTDAAAYDAFLSANRAAYDALSDRYRPLYSTEERLGAGSALPGPP